MEFRVFTVDSFPQTTAKKQLIMVKSILNPVGIISMGSSPLQKVAYPSIGSSFPSRNVFPPP